MFSKDYFRNLFILTCACIGISAQAQTTKTTVNNSPWGVSTHYLAWSPEGEHRDKLLNYAKDGGMKFMREDITFTDVFYEPGKMHFEQADQLIASITSVGGHPLPILHAIDENVPIYTRPEEWRNFVRVMVERYKDKVHQWEIWNELDLTWSEYPDREKDYVSILKIAYEEIKKIDPEATVVLGGLSGWNVDCLRKIYEAGGKPYFDVLAVHPYYDPIDIDKDVLAKANAFMDLVAEYGDSHKPIWLTETGGPTSITALVEKEPNYLVESIRYSLSKIGKDVDVSDIKIGVAVSPRISAEVVNRTRAWLPNLTLYPISFEDLADLDPEEYPVLIGGEGLHIDFPLLNPLVEYVKRGGLLVGVTHDEWNFPFYTVHTQSDNGEWYPGGDAMLYFRMKFEAFWTDPLIPTMTTDIRTSDDALAFGLPAIADIPTWRFIRGVQLHEGDIYYPIALAYHNGEKLPADAIGLYTYSDWKGGVLYSGVSVKNGYTIEEQANLLSRAYLTYLSLGIEKIFWYDLYDDGIIKTDKEHNFGLIDHQNQPKPAYHTYRELTGALGEFPKYEERINLEDPDKWALIFRRSEDNKQIMAIWSLKESDNADVHIEGKEAVSVQLSGKRVQFIVLEDIVTGIEDLPSKATSEIILVGNQLSVKIEGKAKSHLFDTMGRLLVAKDIENDAVFSLLKAGVYILKIEGDTGIVNEKINYIGN